MYPRSNKVKTKRVPPPSYTTALAPAMVWALCESFAQFCFLSGMFYGDICFPEIFLQVPEKMSIAMPQSAVCKPIPKDESSYACADCPATGVLTQQEDKTSLESVHLGSEPSAENSMQPPPSDHPPVVYRGVRSLKHRNDRGYQEVLKKSSSLQNLAAAAGAGSVSIGGGIGEMYPEAGRVRSLSGDRTSSGTVSSRGLSVIDACYSSRSLHDVKTNCIDRALTLESEPKSSRRHVGLVPTLSIDKGLIKAPSENRRRTSSRHMSVASLELERFGGTNIVANAARFWEGITGNRSNVPIAPDARHTLHASNPDLCNLGSFSNRHKATKSRTSNGVATRQRSVTRSSCPTPMYSFCNGETAESLSDDLVDGGSDNSSNQVATSELLTSLLTTSPTSPLLQVVKERCQNETDELKVPVYVLLIKVCLALCYHQHCMFYAIELLELSNIDIRSWN